MVRPESFHMTLHFLGDVSNSRLPELVQGLKVPFRPFELSFSRPRLWPHGIAVLEPDAVPVDLLQLHAALSAALQLLALSTEARAYHPHITVARRAEGASPPANMPPVRWRVSAYALMESRQTRAGGYCVVGHYA